MGTVNWGISPTPLSVTLASDHYKETIDLENKKLEHLTLSANAERDQETEHGVIYNMTLLDIFKKLSQNINAIINELFEPGLTARKFIETFTKEDRLIYVGILILIVMFGLYLIDITS